MKNGKATETKKGKRFRLACGGAVQGVGFRPTVYRLATGLSLCGFVRNSPEGVIIEIEGPPEKTATFIEELPVSLPPLAKLSSYSHAEIAPQGSISFEIIDSEAGKRSKALSSPDSAICRDCAREMSSPGDRRMNYPFTNCTNCGPRYTIISSFPYDRERTSMACFPMCPECLKEYRDPADRRYHAEATCCPNCGPKLFLLGRDGARIGENWKAVEKTKELLAEGKIVAVKGLGGFQLAARADIRETIVELRKRKQRESKPFAVMVKDLSTAKEWATLSEADNRALLSPKGPIILAPKKKRDIIKEVAPGLIDIGVFLPTTPLHVELFRNAPYDALIMTSGNASDEPIAMGNREALERLSSIADFFLAHDRDILRRLDDSVMRSSAGGPFAVRRSRGFVPDPIGIGWNSTGTVLATGAHLQNTGCIITGNEAFFTPHIGDLDTAKSRDFLEESLLSLERFLESEPAAVAVDLHPDYPSRWLGEKLAKERSFRIFEIQHHLAHIASVLGEHGKFPPEGKTSYGIILDGTGYGTDGTAWGGEILKLDGNLRWKRLSHLETFPLIGNEKAVREPWRVALALLSVGKSGLKPEEFFPGLFTAEELEALSSTTGWELSSGAGRLFEAAGSLCGLATVNRHEGEAAILFESLAETFSGTPEKWGEVAMEGDNVFPTAMFFTAFAKRFSSGGDKAKLAMEFHSNFSSLIVEIADRTIPENSVIGLSGGCFINRILRKEIHEKLKQRGFCPLLPYNIPPGDGGVSFGQALLASRSLFTDKEIEEEQ